MSQHPEATAAILADLCAGRISQELADRLLAMDDGSLHLWCHQQEALAWIRKHNPEIYYEFHPEHRPAAKTELPKGSMSKDEALAELRRLGVKI